jgi:hypothetical protein
MLTMKCAACRKKLFRYRKIGQGEVHRCHKDRITRMHHARVEQDGLYCACGRRVGMDRGSYYTMVKKAVTYSGEKINK